MATADTPDRIARFSRTERAAHWLLAATFLVLLFTGMCLYIPSLARVLPRPEAKAYHLEASVVLVVGLVMILLVGDHRSLARTAREVDRLDRDDLAWLAGGPRRLVDHTDAPAQGRLNAGQKLNTAVSVALMIVLGITGTLLWYGEQNTAYRFAGTVLVHDFASLAVGFLFVGHLYLAVFNPATRHALRGMTWGDVDRSWAEHHHEKWARPGVEPARPDSSVPVHDSVRSA